MNCIPFYNNSIPSYNDSEENTDVYYFYGLPQFFEILQQGEANIVEINMSIAIKQPLESKNNELVYTHAT